mmetsp:Transcript_9618/g.37441  ORF Transcript_9618/g.37441 Transcript_9618/m.37441 type:complete len:261 (+) Transcript_9618:1459-2241(+)
MRSSQALVLPLASSAAATSRPARRAEALPPRPCSRQQGRRPASRTRGCSRLPACRLPFPRQCRACQLLWRPQQRLPRLRTPWGLTVRAASAAQHTAQSALPRFRASLRPRMLARGRATSEQLRKRQTALALSARRTTEAAAAAAAAIGGRLLVLRHLPPTAPAGLMRLLPSRPLRLLGGPTHCPCRTGVGLASRQARRCSPAPPLVAPRAWAGPTPKERASERRSRSLRTQATASMEPPRRLTSWDWQRRLARPRWTRWT